MDKPHQSRRTLKFLGEDVSVYGTYTQSEAEVSINKDMALKIKYLKDVTFAAFMAAA